METFEQIEEACVALKCSRAGLKKRYKRDQLDWTLVLALAELGCPVAMDEARRSHRRVLGQTLNG